MTLGMENSPSVESVVETVTSGLGYATLKKEQKDAILSFVAGRDIFVALPTGYGKTICYCCLPMVYDQLKGRTGSIAVIISPLIALMNDQVHKLTTASELSCARIGQSSDDDRKIMDGKYQLVYVSPEALLSKWKWRKMLLTDVYQRNLVAIIIDEAHCVRNWLVYSLSREWLSK